MSAANPGTFVLGFEGRTTAPLAWDADAATVKNALLQIIEGSVSADLIVSGPNLTAYPGFRSFTIEFKGKLAKTNVSQIHGASRRNTDTTIVDRTLQWSYDNLGRLASTSDPAVSNSYQYDALDRMTVDTQTIGGLAPQVTVTRGHDRVGNRTSLAANLTTGGANQLDYLNSYNYDGLNRLTYVGQQEQGTGSVFNFVQRKSVSMVYNALGQLTVTNRKESLSGAVPDLTTLYGYDTTNRLSNMNHYNQNFSVISGYAYSYDKMNRLTQINQTAAVPAHAEGISNFVYDKASQLTGEDNLLPSRPDQNFQYDANGNRNGTSSGGAYTTGTNNLVTEDATYTYLYDLEGNRSQRTKKSDGSYEQFIWDHRNRLSQVVKRSASNQLQSYVYYKYDTANRMVQRNEWNGTTVIDNYFAGFDGINPTLEFEKVGGGTATASNLKHRYLWGDRPDQLFADEQYNGAATASTTVGNVLWALTDHLGTIRDVADLNGGVFSIVEHRTYDSFGKRTDQPGATGLISFGYTGKYHDSYTNSTYHWNRWYDPQLGKWISEDPIGFGGGDANLGRYVRNSPTNFKDSLGLYQESVQDSWYDPTLIDAEGNPISYEEQRALYERWLREKEQIRLREAQLDMTPVRGLGVKLYTGQWSVPQHQYNGIFSDSEKGLVETVDTGRERLRAVEQLAPGPLSSLAGATDDWFETYINDESWVQYGLDRAQDIADNRGGKKKPKGSNSTNGVRNGFDGDDFDEPPIRKPKSQKGGQKKPGKHGQMGNNGPLNEQATKAANEAGLDDDQRDKFHEAISGEGEEGWHNLLDIAKEIKDGLR